MTQHYTPFELGVHGPLRDADRAVAEAAFARLMAARAERRVQLLSLWGGDASAEDAPTALGTWLCQELVAAGATALAGSALYWPSVVADVALWLGDRAILRAPQLTWTFYIAHKKATGYQRAVLTGFTRVDDDRYYVDVAHLVAAWADLAARGRKARPDFLQTIAASIEADA